MPDISVVICVYNRADLIGKCLDSVLASEGVSFDVVVVDDGSTDGTREILSKYSSDERVRLICNDGNLGLMRSRNKGFEAAKAEVVAFTDSDCVVDKKWLCGMSGVFGKDSSVAIAGGDILDPPADGYWGLVYKGFYRISSRDGYVRNVIGANMAVKKGFLAANKFDETLKYGADETDLCYRALSKGYKVYFVKGASVVHFHRSDLRSAWRQQFAIGVGDLYFRMKHGVIPLLPLRSILVISLLLGAVIAPGRMKAYGSSLIAVVFILIVLYQDARKRAKGPWQLIVSLPGRVVIGLASALGAIYGLVNAKKLFSSKGVRTAS
jgi:GT2 family glycosyltransferase